LPRASSARAARTQPTSGPPQNASRATRWNSRLCAPSRRPRCGQLAQAICDSSRRPMASSRFILRRSVLSRRRAPRDWPPAAHWSRTVRRRKDPCCAHAAILEALLRRERTGLGQSTEISMFDGMADWMTGPLLHFEHTGRETGSDGLAHASTLRPRDGSVVIAILQSSQWSRLCSEVLR
jgi:hypothetical protein